MKTESISIRIDKELKHEFFEHLEGNAQNFSKWIRRAMIDELKKGGKNDVSRYENIMAQKADNKR